MTLIYNATFDKNTRKLSFEDKAGNEIYSFTVPERAPAVDDITKPLTFRATQDGSTVKLTKYGSPSGSFQTSRDGGNTWTNYTLNTVITLNTGDEVSFRAKANRTGSVGTNFFQFNMTGKIEAWHNVMSMYRTKDFSTYESVVEGAFLYMFSGCKSLTKAPVLPATSLAKSCYERMFSGCTSLVEAPALSATSLADFCFQNMFGGCVSLTKAPELPATILYRWCYRDMFSGCSKLKEVRISATTTATDALANWLSGVSATGDFYCDPNATIFPTDSASGIPKGWRRIPPVDDPNKPLMLRAIENNSSVTLSKQGGGELSNTYQTSTNGRDWTDYTLGTKISLNKGGSVYFRCSSHPTTQTVYDYVRFEMTGKIEAWHNAYSMISSDFSSAEGSVGDYGMNGLFEYCASLTKAPLLLNALSPFCYIGTFLSTSLTQAPALPATTLAEGCYQSMFYSCNSLTQAPALPATTLAERCYSSMFLGCNSLTQAPALPATTLANSCYESMFFGCNSLTQAPALPATTLAEKCYSAMLQQCSKLKEVRISATKTATDALNGWLYEVSATGDFYCNPNAKIFPSGMSGIPSGWRRLNINDYPN